MGELMSEKALARDQNNVGHLLEPDETVRCSVGNAGIPRIARLLAGGLLLFPYAIQKASVALITERNVYVIKLRGTKGTRILFQAPLGTAEARFEKSSLGPRLVIGDQTLWMFSGAATAARAQAVADAAAGVAGGGSEPEATVDSG
jgi:hypothetical protein